MTQRQSFKVGDIVLVNGQRGKVTSWPDNNDGFFTFDVDAGNGATDHHTEHIATVTIERDTHR